MLDCPEPFTDELIAGLPRGSQSVWIAMFMANMSDFYWRW